MSDWSYESPDYDRAASIYRQALAIRFLEFALLASLLVYN